MDEQSDTIGGPQSEHRSGRGSSTAPAKQPWDVQVDVHLTKGCPSPVFEIRTCLPVSNGNIVFQNNHRPGFNLYFNLIDETGSGYLFPPQAKVKEACWSQVGTTCPSTPIWGVLDPRHVDNARTTLTVYNDNPTPQIGEFRYVLRVTTDDGANYCNLDPGGTDMNGPRV